MPTLDEFKQSANERTGLVPMRLNRAIMPYAEGQIAGFRPEVALQYELTGDAERYTGGEDSEDGANVTGARAGSFEPPPTPGPAARLSHYERRPENSPRAQSVPSEHPGDGTQVLPAELPEGWREFEPVRLRGLAADLSGRNMVEITRDEAVKLIELAESGQRVGRGEFLADDPRGKAHRAGGDEAIAAGAAEALEARTDQPEVEVRPRRGRPPKSEE